MDTFEEVEYPPRLPPQFAEAPHESVNIHRGKTLTRAEFDRLLDQDGRLVDEHRLRKLVFRGGIETSVRKDAWQFLFGLYPCVSTAREREIRLVEYYAKYRSLKRKWQALLQSDAEYSKLVSPPYLKNDGEVSPDIESLPSLTRQSSQSEVESVLGRPLSPDVKQQLTLVEMEAQLYAGRQKIDIKILKSAIRIIDKDVPRTDRDMAYFKGTNNPNLRILRDILITYAAYHSEINYAQGMNDILSRFLQTFNNETEAYWCFEQYLEKFQSDFMEHSVLDKLSLVGKLVRQVDTDLYNYLEHLGVADMTFCHRWMLLGFKRELSAEDSMKCFEILSSHHLELSSHEAEKLRQAQQRKNFQLKGGGDKTASIETTDFTFDVFMCVSLLVHHRDKLFKCQELTEIFEVIARLSEEMNLAALIQKAEVLFSKYCKQSVEDCFLVVDLPSPSEPP